MAAITYSATEDAFMFWRIRYRNTELRRREVVNGIERQRP